MSDKTQEELHVFDETLARKMRDKWSDFALCGDAAVDEKAAVACLEYLYELLGEQPPKTHAVVDSPKAAAALARSKGATQVALTGIGLAYSSDWLAFYDYFLEVGVLKRHPMPKLRQFAQAGVWDCMLYDEMAILIRRPTVATFDDQQRLHSAKGPALAFGDDCKAYVWHGVTIEQDWIERPETIDVKQVLLESNAERRRALSEIVGWDRVADSLSCKVLHEDEFGTLIETDEVRDDDGRPIKFVRVTCHSTGRKYTLYAGQEAKTAKEAVAGTFMKSPDEYHPEQET